MGAAASCFETHRSAIGFVTVEYVHRRCNAPRHEADLGGGRHADVDAVVAHLHVNRPQTILRVAAVAAGLEVEFPTVPGTDDVAFLGETQAAAGLVRRKLFLDARDHLSLTNRAPVVRTIILVGDEAVPLAKNSELEGVDPQHAIAPFHELAELAHHDLVHRLTLACPITRA